MATITNKIANTIAHVILGTAVIGGAALGFAGMAGAASGPAVPTTTTTVPGYEYYPDTYATAAPSQAPGWQGHHGPNHMK